MLGCAVGQLETCIYCRDIISTNKLRFMHDLVSEDNRMSLKSAVHESFNYNFERFVCFFFFNFAFLFQNKIMIANATRVKKR